MLIKHPVLETVTVYIISKDTVFARMLELELCEAGMNAVRTENFPEESVAEGELRVFTASSEVLETGAHPSVQVEFGFSDVGTGESERYFKRPFPVDAFVETVAEFALSIGGSTAEILSPVSVAAASEQSDTDAVSAPLAPAPTDLTFDRDDNAFFYGEERLELTETEFSLLSLLYGRRGETVTREEILTYVWGREENENVRKTNLTDVYIRYLREKLDDRFSVKLILAVRGKGYVLKS